MSVTEKILVEKNRPWVLLVNPSLGIKEFSREDLLRSYLSLGTLASALGDESFLREFALRSGRIEILFPEKAGYPRFEIRVANLSCRPRGQSAGEFLGALIEDKGVRPALMGATATSGQLDEAREIAEAVKQIAPQALRIIGGPHVSIVPEAFLRNSEYQAACMGEGVETMAELVLRLPAEGAEALREISGMAFKDGGGTVQVTPPRKLLFTLDEYPFPSRSLKLFVKDLRDREKNEQDLVYLLAGSGCPYRCAFCAQQAIHRGSVRNRSADTIFAEMKELHGLGFRKFALVQETFLTDEARVHRFCDLIENSSLPLEWTVEARADQVSFELLKRMRSAGLRFIQMGVESGDQALLNSLSKGISLEKVASVRDWCEALKIDTAFYLLVGLPGQGWQSIFRSALFLKDHLPYNRITKHISVAVAIPYPGTRIAMERTVRFVSREEDSLNWPDRNCEVRFDQEGQFGGTSFTETDAMTSAEILEAYIYLDDLGDFLLHAKYDPAFTPEERLKARDFAGRIFQMIQRKTMGDLIARAQEELSPEKYRRARLEIFERDGGREPSMRDVNVPGEFDSSTFTLFLARVKFQNGFEILKCLPLSARIKFMKICAVIWRWCGSTRDRFRFCATGESLGEEYGKLVECVPGHKVDRILKKFDPEMGAEPASQDVVSKGRIIRAFGFEFLLEPEGVIRIQRAVRIDYN